MAIITNSIGSAGGRDFATIPLWIASIPVDVVASGNSYVGQCYNDSEFLNQGISFNGLITDDTTHTVTLTAAPGQSFCDNPNRQTNALRYNQANGAAIRNTISLAIYGGNITGLIISRLQISTIASSDAPMVAIGPNGLGNTPIISQCLCVSGSSGVLRGVAFRVYNCILIDQSGSVQPSLSFGDHGFAVANSVIVVPTGSTTITNAIGLSASGNSCTITNSAVFGCTNFIFNPGGQTIAGSNNASDVSIPFGSSNQTPLTFANQFQDITTATQDWRVITGSGLINNGVTDTADIPAAVDIVDTSRPQSTAWDIGHWELQFGATTVTVDWNTGTSIVQRVEMIGV